MGFFSKKIKKIVQMYNFCPSGHYLYPNERSALSRRNHTNLPKSNKLIFKRLFCII